MNIKLTLCWFVIAIAFSLVLGLLIHYQGADFKSLNLALSVTILSYLLARDV